MSSYTKSTDFASKDSLLTGNPEKVIKGTEIDDELNALQTSVNSKADLNSPALTGSPTAPTIAASANGTQIATTAWVRNYLADAPTASNPASDDNSTRIATTNFVNAAIVASNENLQALYPVGSVYINASVATNPSTLLGFGTWAEIGAGRVLVGQNTSDSDFNSLGETGGSKTSELVSHNHDFSVSGTTGSGGVHNHTATDSGHFHPVTGGAASSYQPGGAYGASINSNNVDSGVTGLGAAQITIANSTSHTHSFSGSGTTGSEGTSSSNGNLQPYIVVKMWYRTA